MLLKHVVTKLGWVLPPHFLHHEPAGDSLKTSFPQIPPSEFIWFQLESGAPVSAWWTQSDQQILHLFPPRYGGVCLVSIIHAPGTAWQVCGAWPESPGSLCSRMDSLPHATERGQRGPVTLSCAASACFSVRHFPRKRGQDCQLQRLFFSFSIRLPVPPSMTSAHTGPLLCHSSDSRC